MHIEARSNLRLKQRYKDQGQVRLTPKGPRILGFKMTNSIDHIVNDIIRTGPNFSSPESVKNITCVDNINK